MADMKAGRADIFMKRLVPGDPKTDEGREDPNGLEDPTDGTLPADVPAAGGSEKGRYLALLKALF